MGYSCEWSSNQNQRKEKKKQMHTEKTMYWISIVILCNSNQMIEKTKVSFIAFWIFYIAWDTRTHTHTHSNECREKCAAQMEMEIEMEA